MDYQKELHMTKVDCETHKKFIKLVNLLPNNKIFYGNSSEVFKERSTKRSYTYIYFYTNRESLKFLIGNSWISFVENNLYKEKNYDFVFSLFQDKEKYEAYDKLRLALRSL